MPMAMQQHVATSAAATPGDATPARPPPPATSTPSAVAPEVDVGPPHGLRQHRLRDDVGSPDTNDDDNLLDTTGGGGGDDGGSPGPPPSSTGVDGRIARCRDLIRLAAREASARLRDRESTVVGVGVGVGGGPETTGDGPSTIGDGGESFELGMALFGGGGGGGGGEVGGGGDPNSVLLGPEDEERLVGIESELRALSGLLRDGGGGGRAGAEETENLPGLRNRDTSARPISGTGAGAGSKASLGTTMTPEEREAEVGRLRARLSFLSGCDGALRALHSADGDDSGGDTSDSKTTLGRRAEAARRAQILLREAEGPLLRSTETNDDDDDDDTWEEERGMAEAVGAKIRAKLSEVSSSARAVLDSHLDVTADSVCVTVHVDVDVGVGGGGDGNGNGPSPSPSSSPALSDAFDALVALSSSPSASDDDGEEGGTTGTELDDVLSDLAADLHRVVLRPMLPPPPPDPSSENKVPPTATTATFREYLGDGRYPTLEWTVATSSSSSSSSMPSTAGGPTSLSSLGAVGEVDGEGGKGERHPYVSSLRSVSTVLEFVCRNFFLGREDLFRAFGVHLFGGGSRRRRGGGDRRRGPDANSLLDDEEDDDDILPPSEDRDDRDGALARDLLRLLHDCIPSTIAEFVAARPILQKSTDNFEERMRSLSLLPSEGSGMPPLSPVSSTLDRRYAEKRRCTILSAGRDLLSRDYHNTVLVGDGDEDDCDHDFDGGGGDPSSSSDGGVGGGRVVTGDVDEALHAASSVFRFPRCAVSVVATDLLRLVTSTLDEATATATSSPDGGGGVAATTDTVDPSSSRLPAVLYRTSRELLDLFRAVVPALHRRELAGDPRAAAVFHDDCCLLAHRCSTLGLRYRDRFSALSGGDDASAAAADGGGEDGVGSGGGVLLGGVCTFVDMVPPFRELADSCLGEMVERHKAMLVGEVTGVGGGGGAGGGGGGVGELGVTLRMNEGDVSWNDAETAVQRGLHHLQQLSQAWTGVLSGDVYRRAMGNLVDTLFVLLLDPVTSAGDVSEAASHFVSSLFGSTLKASSELFPRGGGGGGGVDPDIPRKSCGLWDRFTAVCRFMDMSSLSDVGDALASGTFRSLTGPELAGLVTATFDESERRRTLLRALLESD